MIVDVHHGSRPNVSKTDLKQKIVQMYKITDPNTVFMYGFKTNFGGQKSTGFCLIYDNVKIAQKYEPKYRLVRQGLLTVTPTGRKLRKERKNRTKKVRGTKKAKVSSSAKKA